MTRSVLVFAMGFIVGCRGPGASEAGTAPSGTEHDASVEQVFWTWFKANEARLSRAAEEDAVAVVGSDPMNGELSKVHPSLVFELSGRTVNGKAELVISADGDPKAFDAVTRLVGAAPPLEHWHVTAFRPRAPDLDDLSIQFGDLVLSPDNVFYRSVDQGDHLGLTLHLSAPLSANEEAQVGTFILLDHILGEYDVETLIGTVDWAPLTADRTGLRPLKDLRAEVDSRKRSAATP